MLVDLLLEANRLAPQTTAVSDGMQSLTYRRLMQLAIAVRSVIRKSTSCERVGIMLPASSVFPAVLFGTLWSKRIAVPLNFLLNAEELTKVVDDAGLDLVITIRHFEELASKLPARALYLEDLSLKRKVLIASLRPTPKPPTVDANDTAVLLYTSGTTAEPKGVELTHRNLHSNATDAIATLHMNTEQRMLNVLPPFHVFGLTGNVVVPVILRATVFAIPRFNPAAVIRTVAHERISVLMAIPSMFAAMLRSKSAKPDVFSSVTLALTGGEPLPDSVRVGFLERFGLALRQGYGLTETSPVVAACWAEADRVGTVGRPVRNVEIRIAAEDGSEVPTGGDGEILVRGPNVMKGYYKKPKETRAVLDTDGWFHTGDVGRFDTDGFLAITGRAKEMLIIGGENVFPREIEAVLETHEAVLQCAVVAMPDDLRGELPVAFVIPQTDATITEQELRNHAKQSLAGFKVPKRVVIREDLPTGPTGKLLKRRLKDLI